jgi:alpha/beta superfamily hydrolase
MNYFFPVEFLLENYQNKGGMSTKRVIIEGGYKLEGILNENSKRGGVIICHPHPLYGGDMHNNVVNAIEKGFADKGFTTLRFNFRGVGASEGSYGEGQGEVEDLVGAVEFLKNQIDKDAAIMLAGYSFGAWICSMATSRLERIDGLFLVSYPFAFYESNTLRNYEGKIFLFGGKLDDIGPVAQLMDVYKVMPTIQKSLKIIPTDHFYWGKEEEITAFIKEVVPST